MEEHQKSEQPSHQVVHICHNVAFVERPTKTLCGQTIIAKRNSVWSYHKPGQKQFASGAGSTTCPKCLALEIERLEKALNRFKQKLSELTSKNDPSMMGLG